MKLKSCERVGRVDVIFLQSTETDGRIWSEQIFEQAANRRKPRRKYCLAWKKKFALNSSRFPWQAGTIVGVSLLGKPRKISKLETNDFPLSRYRLRINLPRKKISRRISIQQLSFFSMRVRPCFREQIKHALYPLILVELLHTSWKFEQIQVPLFDHVFSFFML